MRVQKIMAVFAHPDDETFGPGATLARYSRTGSEVQLVCATRGEAGRRLGDPPFCVKKDLPVIREKELREACAELGINPPLFLDIPDKQVGGGDLDSKMRLIYRHINAFKPDVVITFGPDGSLSAHPDHIAIGQLATAAFRQMPQRTSNRLYYHVSLWHSTLEEKLRQWQAQMALVTVEGQPVVASIDVTGFAQYRLRALRRHRTQTEQVHWLWGDDQRILAQFPTVDHFILAEGCPPGSDEIPVPAACSDLKYLSVPEL